jgi:hypothetical protein
LIYIQPIIIGIHDVQIKSETLEANKNQTYSIPFVPNTHPTELHRVHYLPINQSATNNLASQMTATSFRVIVVGGGPVGLTAAHALSKAGIDFLVLERRPEIVIDAGSNLVLSPVGIRTMMQLGILKDINAVSSPLDRIDRQDHNGRNIGDVQWFNYMKKKYAAEMKCDCIVADDLM